MLLKRQLPRISMLLCLACDIATATDLDRKQCAASFAPRNGQPGKDVIWLPTLDEVVVAMLKAANVTAQDYVVDLGSGDGKIPIAAAKQFGAKARGIEYNPELVQLAQCYVRAEGLSDRVQIEQGDIFATDFSDATVLTLYLLTDLNLKLRPTILKLKPGTRVVSNTFQMGEWRPDEYIDSTMGNTHAYLWVVPASVEGTWSFKEQGGVDAFQVSIKQRFQEISLAAPAGSRIGVHGGALQGSKIEFSVAGANREAMTLTGRVEKDLMRLSASRAGRTITYEGRRTHPR